VFPGDIMLGDGDGVMVIPAHLAEEIAEECTGMETFEDFVLEQVRAGAGIIGLYPPTKDENLAKFEAWRKSTGR
jgi:regulator of RNase E activity RraA